jgi:UDP-N-acetyl-D-mannosaminuronic acid dehydrogenase
MNFKRISVVGLGYIGLPTAAMFASRKIEVIGVDVNPQTVDTINQGKIHIVEPDLDMLVHAAVMEGYLRATLRAEPAQAFLISVPTPFKGDHEPDLSYIRSAAKMIAPVLEKGNLVVLESTAPVGATEQLAQWLAELRTDLNFPQKAESDPDINVAHCPERVLPGHVVRELVDNDRVIGGMTSHCSERSVQLYRSFVKGECVVTNARTAEMAKLTENASRDVSIAFANELSLICDRLNIDVWELITLANRHPRVNILNPGPGVGGHCIAVDPWFIVSSAPQEARLIHTARVINDAKPGWVVSKVRDEVANFVLAHPERKAAEVTIACLGLAFKADIDDLRESPALGIANQLADTFPCDLRVVEPYISTIPHSLEGKAQLVSLIEALATADVVIILVDHMQFKEVDPDKFAGKRVIDTCGLLNK